MVQNVVCIAYRPFTGNWLMKGKAISLFRLHTLKTQQAISKIRSDVVLAVQSTISKNYVLSFETQHVVVVKLLGSTVRFHEIFMGIIYVCIN